MKEYLFIIAFLVGAQKLSAQLVIGDNPKQPKAPGKSLLELNNKESDKEVIPGGLLLPKRKKASTSSSGEASSSGSSSGDAGSDVSGFAEGSLAYNEGGYFEILTVKNPSGTTDDDKKLEWKQLASGVNAKRPELINVTGQVKSMTFPVKSGSGTNSEVTIKLPNGYVPYTKGGGDAAGGSGTTAKQVVVKISYNGFGLKQKFGTTAGEGASSGSTDDADFNATVESDNKVKITFLTLQPEQAADFDRILVQAVRN